MSKKTVLIIEDDEDIQQLVGFNLLKAGFLVEYADSGEQALEKIKKEPHPDLILLDIMLPGIDGMEVCKTLKSDNLTAEIPIIMLTSKGEEADIISGLELGAEDYIAKPFSPKILVSRIKVVFRRKVKEASKGASQKSGGIIRTERIVINSGKHEVEVDDEPVKLTPTEFGILKILAKRPGWVYSRQHIIDEIRGYDYMVTPRAIDVQVFSLRKKLGDAGNQIETVRGIGYRFNDK
jgi:two-component system phosphate regulon response regulator PhoB